MNEFDVVITGGGAVGLSAALVLSRARRRVLVVDSGAPRHAPATHMHGFLSRDGMPPGGLLAAGREEVRGYGGAITTGTVSKLVRCSQEEFHVLLAGGEGVSARRLLVATGLRDELPDIPGLADRWARDVPHCPTATAGRYATSSSPSCGTARRRSGTLRSSASGRTMSSYSPQPTS